MLSNSLQDELVDLAFAVCDGTVTDDQIHRIEELLAGDPTAQLLYLRCLELHFDLNRRPWIDAESPRASKSSSAPWIPPVALDFPPNIHPLPPTSPLSFSGLLLNWACVALAVGIVAVIAWECTVSVGRKLTQIAAQQALPTSMLKTESPRVAQVTGMADCRWVDPSIAPSVSDKVPLGRKYALASGLMEIAYDSGAKVILQGPCTYEVESAAGGFLSLGKLTASVEKRRDEESEKRGMGREADIANADDHSPPSPLSSRPAPLFTIRTPIAVLTDLGTEFGVEVNRSGTSRAQVFRGTVELRSSGARDSEVSQADRGPRTSPESAVDGEDSGRAILLTADQSASVERSDSGAVSVLRQPNQTVTFIREMPTKVAAATPAKPNVAVTKPVPPRPAASSTLTTTYRLTDLGSTVQGTSVALNAAGQVVGEMKCADGAMHAFLYAAENMQDLGTLHGGNSRAMGINSTGQIVGSSDVGKISFLAFLYSGEAMKSLGSLGGREARAYAINDAGQVVGGAMTKNNKVAHAFLYTPGARMKDIGALGGPQSYSRARGINNAGQVVGDSETRGGVMHAFLYSSTKGMEDLGTLGGGGSWAYQINDGGQVVGFSSVGQGKIDHAFLYSDATGMEDLGTLGGPSSFAMSINNAGQIVGYSECIDHGTADIHPFLYDGDKMIDLAPLVDARGWKKLHPTAINGTGQIAGYGLAPDRTAHIFLLTPERKQDQEKIQTP